MFGLVLIGCTAGVRNPFAGLTEATTPKYGYSAEHPIRIGYSKDLQENIRFSMRYISCLRTIKGDSLSLLFRASVDDPQYEPSTDGFLGLPLRGATPKGGILDCYMLSVDSGRDTVNLYFDIYHADSIQVPAGLTYICAIDSATQLE